MTLIMDKYKVVHSGCNLLHLCNNLMAFKRLEVSEERSASVGIIVIVTFFFVGRYVHMCLFKQTKFKKESFE